MAAGGGAMKTRQERPARDDIITVKRCAAAPSPYLGPD